MEYIDSRLYYFILDEYFYNKDQGANYSLIIQDYIKLLEEDEFKNLVIRLDILSKEKYDELVRLFIIGHDMYQNYMLSIPNNSQKILSECDYISDIIFIDNNDRQNIVSRNGLVQYVDELSQEY
jgi:hypothetical protein